MKEHNIRIDQARSLVSYDPLTGVCVWKVSQGKAKAGNEVGIIQAGYRKLTIAYEQIKLHRFVWFLSYGVWPSGQIDHIDGNKLNNKLANLRDVSMSVNMQNRYATRTKESGLPYGVRLHKNGKFKASITVGTFDTADEASAAYMRAKRLIHDGCAR